MGSRGSRAGGGATLKSSISVGTQTVTVTSLAEAEAVINRAHPGRLKGGAFNMVDGLVLSEGYFENGVRINDVVDARGVILGSVHERGSVVQIRVNTVQYGENKLRTVPSTRDPYKAIAKSYDAHMTSIGQPTSVRFVRERGYDNDTYAVFGKQRS